MERILNKAMTFMKLLTIYFWITFLERQTAKVIRINDEQVFAKLIKKTRK